MRVRTHDVGMCPGCINALGGAEKRLALRPVACNLFMENNPILRDGVFNMVMHGFKRNMPPTRCDGVAQRRRVGGVDEINDSGKQRFVVPKRCCDGRVLLALKRKRRFSDEVGKACPWCRGNARLLAVCVFGIRSVNV